jgi:DNA-binding beta-propeller fold protein YncE
VTPVSTVTNQPGKPIEVGKGAWAIAITPDGKTVYVVNSETSTVTPISCHQQGREADQSRHHAGRHRDRTLTRACLVSLL